MKVREAEDRGNEVRMGPSKRVHCCGGEHVQREKKMGNIFVDKQMYNRWNWHLGSVQQAYMLQGVGRGTRAEMQGKPGMCTDRPHDLTMQSSDVTLYNNVHEGRPTRSRQVWAIIRQTQPNLTFSNIQIHHGLPEKGNAINL